MKKTYYWIDYPDGSVDCFNDLKTLDNELIAYCNKVNAKKFHTEYRRRTAYNNNNEIHHIYKLILDD